MTDAKILASLAPLDHHYPRARWDKWIEWTEAQFVDSAIVSVRRRSHAAFWRAIEAKERQRGQVAQMPRRTA